MKYLLIIILIISATPCFARDVEVYDVKSRKYHTYELERNGDLYDYKNKKTYRLDGDYLYDSNCQKGRYVEVYDYRNRRLDVNKRSHR